MIDPYSPVPRWRQVADVIKGRIEDGTYPPGERVPSVVELLEEFGIATGTGQKVHRALRAEGLIVTVPGLGSYVAPVEGATKRAEQS
ncbi:winged helix-turn-helix domain-containing protein [Nonomuraea dietziae]|uniref:GntR family transcriptional regulator n=1 Tax=Nonomuraea dietziae TaxID=65515 RepID=UPI0033EEE6FC